MQSNGIPPFLAARGKNFFKSTFILCTLDYKNLTINAVKWLPFPPCRQRQKNFLNQPLNCEV